MYKKEKEVVDGTVEDLEVVIGHCGDSRLLMFTLEGDYRSKLKNSQKQMFSAVTKLNVGWSKSSLNVADKRVKGSSQAVEKTALKKKGEVVLDRIYETADHQPSLESERNRIIQSGNQVINSRVNGVLAVSRALGDRDLKMTQAVIATPDIFSLSMSSLFEPNVERASGAGEEAEPNEDEKEVFIVLASDGLWAATTSHSVEVFIKRYLQTLPTTNKEHSNEGSREEELKGLCEEIMEDLLFERFSADNVAIIILRITKLKQGEQRAGAAVRKEQDKEQNENVLEQTGQQETTVGNVSSLEVFHNDDPGNAAQRTPKPTENKAPEKLGAVRHHLNHELETEIEVDVEMDV